MPGQPVPVLGYHPLPLQPKPLPLRDRQGRRTDHAQQGLPRQHRNPGRLRVLRQERRLQTAELSQQQGQPALPLHQTQLPVLVRAILHDGRAPTETRRRIGRGRDQSEN